MKEFIIVRIPKEAYNQAQILRTKMVRTLPNGKVKVLPMGEVIKEALDLLEKNLKW